MVTIGQPFSHRLQGIKLQSLLNGVPNGDKWEIYMPDCDMEGSCHGAMFSTADHKELEDVLNAVKNIRH